MHYATQLEGRQWVTDHFTVTAASTLHSFR